MTEHVQIIMIEDDDGHARLIEKNIRRAGVNNEIIPFATAPKPLNSCSAATARVSATKAAPC